ncbi:MAG TPA: S9 family peptidase, partial [Pyrinomonadaceae bacterium]|nr:S9 family peptidase [Pyrinomonadaceae bacterium]
MNKYSYKQFAATQLFYPVARYSPDGNLIGHITNTTGQFNLWTAPSGGGFARQLTSYTDNTVRNFQWSPDGRQIALHADQNGDEFYQIYLLPESGGWAEPVTDAIKAQHHLAEWSPDGSVLAYAGNDREPKEMDVILYDLATRETRRPMPSGKHFIPSSWSPDGRFLLVSEFKTNVDENIHILNAETGEIINATPHGDEGLFLPGPWAPDGSGFYIRSSYRREFLGLAFYSMADQKWNWLETPEHDIEHAVISKNGKLVWSVNENGASKLRGRDLNSNRELTMPDLPLCVIGGMDISPDGTHLALIIARPTEAVNLYEVNLTTAKIKALSQSMLGSIDPVDMIEPESVFFPSFDGRQIPAWLYRPTGEGKFPVVLSIHGGPEAQERTQYNYNGMYQYLLNRGIGVLAPNIRGSTGYGLSYQKLIYRDWGGDELKDIECAAKFLRSLDWVDADRIAVFGGSFGGFATLSALTRLPEYWACGVDIVGPSNLVTFAKSFPPQWQEIIKILMGDPDEDYDFLTKRSPIAFVDQIRAPLLVIQGANDPRVVKAESDQ